jgi:hypothetical protein
MDKSPNPVILRSISGSYIIISVIHVATQLLLIRDCQILKGQVRVVRHVLQGECCCNFCVKWCCRMLSSNVLSKETFNMNIYSRRYVG